MKIVIRVLLGIAVVFMAFICVKSVVTPIQFEEARIQREVKVINNLVSLRIAEAQFRLATAPDEAASEPPGYATYDRPEPSTRLQ